MPDSLAPLPAGLPTTPQLLPALLDLLASGVLYYTPQLDDDGAVVDFAFAYLNPAAQRLLGLPARPTTTYRQQFPASETSGSFAFLRAAWLAGGESAQFETLYQVEGHANYLRAQARRLDAGLLVSFEGTADQPRAAVEEEINLSKAREQAARAAAETQRGELQRIFEQAPVAIAAYRGPTYIIELANPLVCALWGRTQAQALHTPLFELLPEIVGQGFEQLLDQVMATGEPYVAKEMLSTIDRNGGLDDVYWNFVYLPLREEDGRVSGVIVVANEVTEQVLARQQVQILNEELATANDELEGRVAERTLAMEAALREAERQRGQARAQQALLGQILGQVPAAIATLTGPEHRYSFFNEPYQALSAGRTVLGLPVTEVFPEVIEQGFISLLDQVYATGQPFIGTETVVMLHDQATGQAKSRYLDFIYQPLLDGQQRTQGILAFILDVTDRVRARKQAETLQAAMLAVVKRQGQDRENVYQLFEQAPAAICLLREPDHRIDYLNPAYQALFPGQELRGHTLAQLQPEATALLQLFDEVYRTGQAQQQNEVAIFLAQAAGQPATSRYYDFTYQAYREDGHIVGVSLFGSDVTERVLARQQREAQQAELRRIFAQAPVAIAILRGPSLVIELANQAVEVIWGRTAAQVMGRPYFEALPETAGQGFEQIMAGVLRTGEPFFVTEAPVQLLRAHTGQPALGYVNFVFQPLFDDQQRTTGLMAIGVEVTEQVLARQQVQALNEEMQATNQELHITNTRLLRTNTDLDTFVYTASHDLKSPITNVEGLLLALREHLPPNALEDALVPRLLDMMGGAVSRFQQTLSHLTDVSRLQQELEQPAEAVDLPALVEAVRLDILPELAAADAALTVQVSSCPTVYFSPKNLRSILYNLLSNAVKYRAPGRPPAVELHCHRSAGRIIITVQDNGLGLSKLQQGELFQMFRRLHTHVEGSGVGLYMVKKIIENAGGTLTVQSELGVGSTFTVSLPVPD